MAGLADSSTALAQHNPPTVSRQSSARRSLPDGPCNYRDAALQCGCGQFWDKFSADLHDDSVEHRPSSARSTWCVCGHHACFHLRASRAPEQRRSSITQPHTNGRHQSEMHTLNESQAAQSQSLQLAPLGISSQLQRPDSSGIAALGRIEQNEDMTSQASTSGLPRIPSVCMLSHERRVVADKRSRHVASAVNQSQHTVTGLGLSMMHLDSGGAINRQQSQSPTIPDDISLTHDLRQPIHHESELLSTRAGSIATELLRPSPSRGVLDPILEFNRNLQLDVPGDTIPNTYNPDEFIQSATEVATPSLHGTPDLCDADQAVKEGKQLIDTLARLTSTPQQSSGSPNRVSNPTSAPSSERGLTKSPVTAPHEQLQNLLQTGSPQTIQKLVSYLAPLHNLLNSIPNVANTMRDLGSRLDMLENGSFNYVAPEELNQTLTMYEDRLVDLEHRVDQHDIRQQTMEADQNSSSSGRRHIDNVITSFGSNHSLQSTTSSALILAAMDRKDTEMEIGNIKDRLDMLEAAAMPSTLQPWEVEVVLLPWGRDLRGIWFSPDEPMHDTCRTTTQESEEWTQARGSKPASDNSPSSFAARAMDSSPQAGPTLNTKAVVPHNTESGWSSQAISDWASGSTEDWLFPKACGSNNMVYKRLQSRGFIRHIALASANARDLQIALSSAFGDLLEHLSYTEQDGDPVIDAYPGLRASFIPLRKVIKESKLRFLTPAEMSSSALWSAQFLAAGVLMRVSGGRKRLYVTQREAYIQRIDDLGSSWTWQELRQLPRYQEDQDSQMEGNEEHYQPQVAEADAKEPCWQFFEAYDAPAPSLNSSFGSHGSVQLSMRPADRQWRRSITPNSILKNRNFHPISPLSENHPRPYQLRSRTASASVLDQLAAGPSKRRLQTSPVKQSSAPQPTSRTPSASVARLKRRRTSNSESSHRRDLISTEAQMTIWNATPRRSREPPSPYPSSLPGLPRSNSDVASRPSQRSIAVAGKSTPFAYATPHSGPIGFGAFNNGGDTEPDDDDDAYDGDDGEQSWRGVTDGDDDASSSASDSADDDDAQLNASFSGDDSGFGTNSEDDDDDEHSDGGVHHNAQRHTTTDDEEDGDVFDTLLDVLEH